jgi:hypothetical protein
MKGVQLFCSLWDSVKYGGMLSWVNASHSYKHGDRDPAPTDVPSFPGLIMQRRRRVKCAKIKYANPTAFLDSNREQVGNTDRRRRNVRIEKPA